MTTTKKSVWDTLSKVDVSEHLEKKGRFDYLSWAWAWGFLMGYYPEATFENHLNSDGYPCFYDPNGSAMVRVTLTIGNLSHTEDFAVTDYNNNSIKNPDSSDVNTALKRCLVKAMAYFGLGYAVYAGSDLVGLPSAQDSSVKTVKKIKPKQKKHQEEPDIDDEMMACLTSMKRALVELDAIRPSGEIVGWLDKSVSECLEWYVEQSEINGWGDVTPDAIIEITKKVYLKAESYE